MPPGPWWAWWTRQSAADALNRQAAELRRRVQELESQRHQAQAILESMVEGVVAVDRQVRVLWLNRSAQRLLGWTPEQAAGKRLVELVRQADVAQALEQAVSGRTAACEVQGVAVNNQTLRIQAAPCQAGSGEAQDAAAVVVVQDVTEVRRLEGMRREFVANVSHELKTPLTSIQSLAETLLGGALEDPANNRRFVGMVAEDAARLSRLIDDLLELSQIESKAVPLKRRPVLLRPLLEEVIARLRHQLEGRSVRVELSVPPETPPVDGDPERLRQIFSNLLDNAIKFNQSGGRIAITAGAADGQLRVSIEDTGIGIPETDLPRIFERFYRVDKARSRELGGTGLGLAIVKHLVELHGGSVSAASRVDRGTTFTLLLPPA